MFISWDSCNEEGHSTIPYEILPLAFLVVFALELNNICCALFSTFSYFCVRIDKIPDSFREITADSNRITHTQKKTYKVNLISIMVIGLVKFTMR